MLLTVQPQRQAAALPACHVIPPELLPVSQVPAIGHCSLHEFPVTRKSRLQQTGGKGAFVAGLLRARRKQAAWNDDYMLSLLVV
jgi:hypothetical protein